MYAKLHKNLFKCNCYFGGVKEWLKPAAAVNIRLNRLQERLSRCDISLLSEIEKRAMYYNRLEHPFPIPDTAETISGFSVKKSWSYFLDYKRCFRYFPDSFRINTLPGDITAIPEVPTLVKSRPVSSDNHNSILLKLNRVRHYYLYPDTMPFEKKVNRIVWRGKCQAHKNRRFFLENFHTHPLVDAGDTHKKSIGQPWHKNFLSIPEQLRSKFILSIEGKDVATNLKWIMASNSLCFMPRPEFETWFMEGILKPGIHYVEIRQDYSDLEEKLNYYIKHTDEALKIIRNANSHVARFFDPDLEDLIMLRVLSQYFELSGQFQEKTESFLQQND